MSKNIENINPHEKARYISVLEEATKRIQGKNPALTFTNELLTESEKITIGRRILIAQMILAGETQSEIRFQLGVSPNTFTRTRKWLNGQLPNFDDALKEFKEKEKGKIEKNIKISEQKYKQKKQYSKSYTFSGMQHRYPAHFLLFNIFEEIFSK